MNLEELLNWDDVPVTHSHYLPQSLRHEQDKLLCIVRVSELLQKGVQDFVCDLTLSPLQLWVGLENLKLLKILPLESPEVYIAADIEDDKVLVLLGHEHADVKELLHDKLHCLVLKFLSHKALEERTLILRKTC